MISRWKWMLKQTFKKLWFRATLFAIVAIITALLSILFKSMIPESVSVKVGAEAVDNILNILASSMLAVTTFSLSIMVTAYGSATTNVTPRATRLVVEDVTTQNVLATFIGSFLFSLVGIIALNMGAYGERGRVILFIVTLVVIALILITLLRWIQHLTSLGRVGETTAKVEQAAIETFIARARNPCLGGYPWLENNEQPKGTVAVYPKKIGYVEYVDMVKLSKLLTNDPRHVYLVAQPGSFIHPSTPVLYLSQGQESSISTDLLETIIVSDIGYFNNYLVELVAGSFSLLSAFNFTLWYIVISRKTIKPLIRDIELRFFLLIALGVIIVTSFQVWHIGMYDLHGSFIHSFFLASSMLTDNGLATQDYASWPTHTIVFLLLSSFFGGCIGSTCGGIKSLRFLILFKQSKHEINQLSHPRALLSVNVGGKIVTDRVMRSVWSFFFLYTLFTVFFILVLNGMGYDFLTSFATVAACINNMGLGFGATASSFGVLNDIAKCLMCIAMILGRLEIYPVIILFSGFFWRS
ncbi:TPA: DUF2254 family protein [Escherichia coli]